MGPESKVVSTIGIDEGIDYLSREFIAKLDDNVNTIIEQYSSLSMNGTLSSENIDGLVAGIKAKVNELQNSYTKDRKYIQTTKKYIKIHRIILTLLKVCFIYAPLKATKQTVSFDF